MGDACNARGGVLRKNSTAPPCGIVKLTEQEEVARPRSATNPSGSNANRCLRRPSSGQQTSKYRQCDDAIQSRGSSSSSSSESASAAYFSLPSTLPVAAPAQTDGSSWAV